MTLFKNWLALVAGLILYLLAAATAAMVVVGLFHVIAALAEEASDWLDEKRKHYESLHA